MAGEPGYVVLKNAVPKELCPKLEGDFNQASIKRKGIKFSEYRTHMSAGDVIIQLSKSSKD
ncbi:hypothetical protein N7493_001078 [Penicillium malachiteum]|uniref:Uncharacterized protein n=1 Tax=Penicillium malachiteum TaxID=1324776 RepID=A0AAD6HTJ4_9EURO|nr:hypothetical protein N7493_001078 [Penicillium malachiteum]